MHITGRTDLELLARQRMSDAARMARRSTSVKPPPRRRTLRRQAAKGLRNLADVLD
jgi:hypothetical protein